MKVTNSRSFDSVFVSECNPRARGEPAHIGRVYVILHSGPSSRMDVEDSVSAQRKSERSNKGKSPQRFGFSPVADGGRGSQDGTKSSAQSVSMRTSSSRSSQRRAQRAVLEAEMVVAEIAMNALLDDGSTATFLNAKVAAEFGLVGDTQEVRVDMLNGKHATFSSELVTVRLKSPDGTVDEEICARTADRIAANLPVLDWKQHASSWQHLSHIEFPRINRRRPIDLLIGIDNAQFHRCKAEVTGGDGEPIARLTPLGWTCVGKPSPSESNPQRTVHSQSFLVNKLSRSEADNNLERLVRKFWEVEDYPSSNNILTKDEKKAVRIVTESLTYTDSGRYTVGIPWKRKPPAVPNSYAMAMKRLKSTEKRLNDKPKWADEYRQVFQKCLEKGYVSRVHQPSKQHAGFCLLHFPIVRLGRETTKVRVVFDAAAKVDGESLNSYIHPGPKLQRCIADVLLKFREKPVALGCEKRLELAQLVEQESGKSASSSPTLQQEVFEVADALSEHEEADVSEEFEYEQRDQDGHGPPSLNVSAFPTSHTVATRSTRRAGSIRARRLAPHALPVERHIFETGLQPQNASGIVAVDTVATRNTINDNVVPVCPNEIETQVQQPMLNEPVEGVAQFASVHEEVAVMRDQLDLMNDRAIQQTSEAATLRSRLHATASMLSTARRENQQLVEQFINLQASYEKIE